MRLKNLWPFIGLIPAACGAAVETGSEANPLEVVPTPEEAYTWVMQGNIKCPSKYHQNILIQPLGSNPLDQKPDRMEVDPGEPLPERFASMEPPLQGTPRCEQNPAGTPEELPADLEPGDTVGW